MISGGGFGDQPVDLFAWADTVSSGFSFELDRALETQIQGILGPVAAPATGDLKIWKGRAHSLENQSLLTQGRLFTISDTTLFVASHKAAGPVFSAFAGSANTLSSSRSAAGINLAFDPIELEPDGASIRVTVVIETGDDPGTGGTIRGQSHSFEYVTGLQSSGDPSSPAWAATFLISADLLPASQSALAQAVAELLQAQFGSIGLTATTNGAVLSVGHTLGVHAGFITVVY